MRASPETEAQVHAAHQHRMLRLDPFALAVLGAAVCAPDWFRVEDIERVLRSEGIGTSSTREDVLRFLIRREVYHQVVEELSA